MTAALEGGVVNVTPRPHFTPGKDPVPILQEAGWAPGPVWTGWKSRPHRGSIPDRPALQETRPPGICLNVTLKRMFSRDLYPIPIFIHLSSPLQPLELTILQECGVHHPLTLSVSNIASPFFRHRLKAQILPLIVAIL